MPYEYNAAEFNDNRVDTHCPMCGHILRQFRSNCGKCTWKRDEYEQVKKDLEGEQLE